MNEEVQVGLGLNTTAFQDGLKGATREVSSFGSKLAAPITAVRSLAAAISGAFALGTLKAMSDHAEQILNISEALNISAENFQKFNGAMSYSGVSSETSQKALTKFTMKLGDLDKEGSKAGAALSRMGIDARDSNGDIKGTITLIGEISDAFKDMPDKSERSRIAVELFGKQGLKMVAALSQGSEEMAALGETTPIISQKSLETLDVAGDKAAVLWNRLKGLGTTALAKTLDIVMPDESGKTRGRDAAESAEEFAARRAAELEKTVAGSKEHLAYEKALLASQMARETVGKQAWLTQKLIAKLTEDIAKLEQSKKEEDRLLAESKKTEQLKLQADFAKLSADHMAKQVAIAERFEAIAIAEKEFRLVGVFQKQAVLRDKLSKMTVVDGEYLKTEAKLKAVSIELADKQVAAEKRKLEVTSERIKQLTRELSLAPDQNKADEIKVKLNEKALLLLQQQKDVAQKAGEEQVKLASLQASLQQKRAQLTETKADASKYTIAELAELGGRGNDAQRKASFDAWRFQQADQRVSNLKAQGANPEDIAKAIAERESIRKNLDTNFIKSTELKAPWADLEDAIRKLTAEMESQRAVAAKMGGLAPEEVKPADEAKPLTVEEEFAARRARIAAEKRGQIILDNQQREKELKEQRQRNGAEFGKGWFITDAEVKKKQKLLNPDNPPPPLPVPPADDLPEIDPATGLPKDPNWQAPAAPEAPEAPAAPVTLPTPAALVIATPETPAPAVPVVTPPAPQMLPEIQARLHRERPDRYPAPPEPAPAPPAPATPETEAGPPAPGTAGEGAAAAGKAAELVSKIAGQVAIGAEAAGAAEKALAVAGMAGKVAGVLKPLAPVGAVLEAGKLATDFSGETGRVEASAEKGMGPAMMEGLFAPLTTIATAVKMAVEVVELDAENRRFEVKHPPSPAMVEPVAPVAPAPGEPEVLPLPMEPESTVIPDFSAMYFDTESLTAAIEGMSEFDTKNLESKVDLLIARFDRPLTIKLTNTA